MTTLTTPHQARPKPANPYAENYHFFERDTADHVLTVVHDDGYYKHLRMRNASGGSAYAWDVITWPGYLTTVGDIADGYTFTRELDMIEFFRTKDSKQSYHNDNSPSIDFRYWLEKLASSQRNVKVYEPDLFLQYLITRIEEHDELGDDALKELREIAESGNARPDPVTDEAGDGLDAGGFNDKPWNEDPLRDEPSVVDDEEPDFLDEEAEDSEYDQEQRDEAKEAITSLWLKRNEILDAARIVAPSQDLAAQWLMESDEARQLGYEYWDMDFRDYSYDAIRACYAVNATIVAYDKYLSEKED